MSRPLLLLVLLLGLLGLVAAPPATADPVDDAPPATIRVCRSSGAVEAVPFKEYVKTVLPVEFYSSWPQETLRAGAVVIRSYAWYFVRNPISDRCDLGDTTRHQVYAPEKQRRTARTDQAVEDTWHLRMWDPQRREIAFAQYCSAGCRTHAAKAGAGRYMDQDQAYELGQAGRTHLEMLWHFYRNLPVEITDWTEGLGLRSVRGVFSLTDPQPVTIDVDGVAAGDRRVQVAAFAVCTLEGESTSRLLDVQSPVAGESGTVVRFEDLSGLQDCQDAEAAAHFQLIASGHVARTLAVPAWDEWSSAKARDVVRVGDLDDPVSSSVAVSQATWDDQVREASGSMPSIGPLVGSEESDGQVATQAVIARADAFPDALGATALAGMAGPLLLHASGPDASLAASVSDELARILPPGATVHIVGGEQAISARVEEQIRDMGFEVVRTSGLNRVSTAIAVADLVTSADGGNGRAVLVRGFPNGTAGWADAVSVAPWAARTGTPILVTSSERLHPDVEAWIEDPANGIDEVLVIGGTRAVSGSVEAAVDGATVTRVAGERRDDTAIVVADELWGTRGAPEPAAVVAQNVFRTNGWPSAVVGAGPAALQDAAAISVWRLVPPTTTGFWLDSNAGLPAIVVGGPGVVRPSVEDALAGA